MSAAAEYKYVPIRREKDIGSCNLPLILGLNYGYILIGAGSFEPQHPQHDQMVPVHADGRWLDGRWLDGLGNYYNQQVCIYRRSLNDFRLKNEECYDLLTAKDPQVLEQVYTTMKPGANTLDFPHAIYIDGIDVGGGLHTGAISIEESGFPIEESGFPIKES